MKDNKEKMKEKVDELLNQMMLLPGLEGLDPHVYFHLGEAHAALEKAKGYLK